MVYSADLITRRQALARVAYLLGGAIAAPTVAGVLAGCSRDGAEQAGTTARALSSEQKEMVASVAEHILPETDTPGARAAGVHDFIDTMLSEYYPEEERARFLAGLERMDRISRDSFGKPYQELTPEQQLQLVEAFNRSAFRDSQQHPMETSTEPVLQDTEVETGRSMEQASVPSLAVLQDREWDQEDVGRGSFFRTLKELVLVGYYTSEVGATQELRMNPMGVWRGDIPYAQAGRAWA